MKIEREKLPYREGAIGIIIDSENRFLVMQTVGYKENEWRFPGGGVDPGETPEQTLLRELEEELDSKDFKILKKSKTINQYEWPEEIIKARYEKKGELYRGQRQHQYLVRFAGDPDSIKIDTNELRQIKWATLGELPKLFVFPNQWELAKPVIEELLELEVKS